MYRASGKFDLVSSYPTTDVALVLLQVYLSLFLFQFLILIAIADLPYNELVIIMYRFT